MRFSWRVLCVLVASVAWSDMRPAARLVEDVAAYRLRGPAPRVRARIERVARAAPGEAVGLADDVLRALRDSFEPALARDLAAETIGLRNRALATLHPLPSGFRGAFLAATVDAAALSDWELGVPASITLGQAILESGWGRSAPGHNLFGMKGEGPAGSVRRRVVEYRGRARKSRMANFRLYTSVDEAIADHGRVLATSARYARARAVEEDPAAYAKALQGTYATDPRYAAKLADLDLRYGLSAYNCEGRAPYVTAPGFD